MAVTAPASRGVGSIVHKPLTQTQIDAALLDPTIFCHRYCWIRGPGGKQEKFELWDFQREVMECFDDEQRVLVLKARQLGISWLADAYALWLCSANSGQTVIIISQGQRESKEEMRRIRFMHQRLPPELRRRTGLEVGDAHSPDTTEHLEFPDMDSRILSLPSTEHAGTSYTATLVVVHELAKIATAPNLIAAITPTMADFGRLFIVSTAYGFSGTFYDYWEENGARWHEGQTVGDKGEDGSFRPVFIPWHRRPGRNQKWYEATARAFTRADTGSDKRSSMKQEYPGTPTEAFQGSADAVFSEEFNRYIHGISGSRADESNYEVAHGIDLGVNHAYSYLIEIQGNSAFVFAELHLTNDTVESLGKATAEADREFGLDPSECISYPDPAGIARNQQTLETDYQVLQESGLLVDDSGFKVAPSQRVDQIKGMLKQGRLWISLDCPDLIEALERAQWKKRRAPNGNMVREDTYAKDGKYEHPLDALGYALSRIWPPITAAAVSVGDGRTPAATAVANTGSYSGSEFGG